MRTCTGCSRKLEECEFARPGAKCKGCELYNVTRSNQSGRGKPLEMSREEVLSVFGSAKARRCNYCGISEAAYVSLAIPTPSGKPGLRLGLDRRNTTGSYTVDNVVICCLVCNRIKSSTFSHNEMLKLGRTVCAIWQTRGIDARVDDTSTHATD